jgi:hypothetical protein
MSTGVRVYCGTGVTTRVRMALETDRVPDGHRRQCPVRPSRTAAVHSDTVATWWQAVLQDHS